MTSVLRTATALERSPPVLQAIEGKEDQARIDALVRKSQKILLKISTLFPFDFFPDTLEIDENKVSIVTRSFYFSERVHSVLIENISKVTVSTNFWFGSLELVDSTNPRYPISINVNFLQADQAKEARRVITGLVTAKKENVDFTKFKTENLEEELAQIGIAKGVE